MKVEKAALSDAKAIRALIDIYARRDKMLSRSLSYLYENIREFFVVRNDGKVVGCCALHITWSDLAEVKSLAVHPDYLGKGAGKALLNAGLNEADELGIPTVFTLTLEPEFFIKHGFKRIPKEKLPMKIWGECIQCPKYPECDEIALEYTFR